MSGETKVALAIPDFSDSRVILITSYPRSGGTWACRALAQALDCPSLSWSDDPHTLRSDPVVEGLNRKSQFAVRRAHTSLSFFHSYLLEKNYAGIATAVRDPRDVAVSCWHHWPAFEEKGMAGLEQCVRQLCGLELGPPLQPMVWGGYAKDRTQNPGRPGWAGFVENWLAEGVPVLRYESHIENPYNELRRLVRELGRRAPLKRIRKAAEANLFANREKDRVMRRGGVGEWREVLPAHLSEMIVRECGDVMALLGYE